MPNFSNPAIAIAYCQNTAENGNWCKTEDEIDIWLELHSEYFVHQQTRVNSELWAENFDGDETYFPLVSQQSSWNYGTVEFEPSKRDKGFVFQELKLSFNGLTINDSTTY